MFMRHTHPNIISKQALPLFVLEYLNPFIGGIVIATLIISVVATGAGLTLGISTMFCRDIYSKFSKGTITGRKEILINRVSVIVISILVSLMVFLNLDSLILKWAFLSMTLRGTVIFVPLIFALMLKGHTPKKFGYISMIASPLITILLSVFNLIELDPLYVGLGVSFLIFIIGYIKNCIYI